MGARWCPLVASAVGIRSDPTPLQSPSSEFLGGELWGIIVPLLGRGVGAFAYQGRPLTRLARGPGKA